MSLLKRIAPKLLESFRNPLEKNDPAGEWERVQKEGPGNKPFHPEAFGPDKVGPPNYDPLSGEDDLEHSGASRVTGKSSSASKVVPAKPTQRSDMTHSLDAIDYEDWKEKEMQRRLNRARKELFPPDIEISRG